MSASSSTSLLHAAPRRKACDACANAKVRCDKGVICARCRARGLRCVYPGGSDKSALQAASQSPDQFGNGRTVIAWSRSPDDDTSMSSHATSSSLGTAALTALAQDPATLIDNPAAIAIQTRWLKPFLVDGNERQKIFPPSTTRYIREVLKSYVSMAATDSRLPPFIHHIQVSNDSACHSLSKGLGLLRVLSVRASANGGFASELFNREMTSIMESGALSDTATLLSALQAYLLYSMALYFSCGLSGLRENVVNLQQLASMLFSKDTATENKPWATPSWTSWIIAEAKRRTTFTIYLFDNLLCAMDNLPIYVATELSGLPAPAPKNLWDAASLDDWQRAHHAYLSVSDGVPLEIHELWPTPPECSEGEIRRRQDRISAWLQRVDEYGMMMFAVTSSSHT